jgi:hypothetical protein
MKDIVRAWYKSRFVMSLGMWKTNKLHPSGPLSLSVVLMGAPGVLSGLGYPPLDCGPYLVYTLWANACCWARRGFCCCACLRVEFRGKRGLIHNDENRGIRDTHATKPRHRT